MRPKIGIYSGTFDPVHVGHVQFALQAIEDLGLQKVVFLPEANPREKINVTDIRQRIEMLKIATSLQKNIEIEDLNCDKFSVSETMPLLQQKYPDYELVFLLGSDVVKTFVYRWQGLQDFLANFDLAIALRKQDKQSEIEQIIKDLKMPCNFNFIQNQHSQLASTKIRRGQHYITDIDPGVADYIVDSSLYEAGDISTE